MNSNVQRLAIVTGDSQGIGLATVRKLQADGLIVHILDLAPGPEATYADAVKLGAILHEVDVTNLNEVERAVAECPRAPVLVTSTGIAGPNATTWDYPPDEWHRIMAINLDGTWHCLRVVAPRMIEQGYGRIVTAASVAGKEGNPNASAYSASKAAVIALTKSMGKELAKYDIAVNCVTPAAARTRIFDQMKREHIDFMLSKIPRGRFLRVGEAAAMIAWQASEDCSFTTGAVFDLTGGRSTY